MWLSEFPAKELMLFCVFGGFGEKGRGTEVPRCRECKSGCPPVAGFAPPGFHQESQVSTEVRR